MKLCPKCGKHFSDDANFCPVDAARLTPLDGAGAGDADPLAVRFEIGDRLGGATTGEVRRATDKQSGRPVAVKVVSPQVMALTQVAQRIDRELKQLERVDSPSVAKVVASGKKGDQAWIATDFVDRAQTLAQVLAARGPMDPPRAAELVSAIGEALIEAAKVGVVHRDLSPKNVLLVDGQTGSGSVKLINFCTPSPTSERAPGVPEYVAPEVIEGKQLDQRSNIYSLGAIYYHAITGGPPFGGAMAAVHAAHLAGGVEAPSKRVAIPSELDTLVLRALDRNPAKRYLTVRQFVDEVLRVARGEVAGGTAVLGGAGKPAKQKEAIQTLMGVPPAAQGPVVSLGPADVKQPPPMAAPAAPVPVASPMAPTMAPTPAMLATAPTAPPAPAPSPWAPPPDPVFTPAAAAQTAAAPAVGAVFAAPVAAPIVPSAPVMPPAPVMPAAVGAPPSGKKKGEEDKSAKAKFRETMWFKKGELDAAAAEAAAEEAARTGKVSMADKADSLPIEERYKDDGTLDRGDRDKYSLKTGDTRMMPTVQAPDPGHSVSERELVGEMKGARTWVIAIIVIAILAGGGIAAYFGLS